MNWLILLAPLSFIQGDPHFTEAEGVRRVQAHLLIEDPDSALNEASMLAVKFPDSLTAGKTLVEALAANGHEEEALDLWNRLSANHPDLLHDRHLLEELSWGVLKKGIQSTQYGIRLAAMIGTYLTHDVRAVPILLKMMRDSNAVIRSIAVQMASSYRDAPLKDEIARLMNHEKVWMVRLEVIKAVGMLRMKELAGHLKALIQSDKTTYEERQLAIGALLEIYDEISLAELKDLARSNRAGLRHLACSIAAHFEMKEAKSEIFRLIQDTHPNVRIAALNAFGLFYREGISLQEAKDLLSAPLKDSDPAVAITAAWAALLIDPELGGNLDVWLQDSLAENRRLAAAALAATGSRGASLAVKVLKTSLDSYVKANVALGLLGQRIEVERCCDMIYDFLQTEKRTWMWDTRPNPLFQILAPSQVRHIDQIPNYPEAIDQMTRLNLVSLLALVEDPRAVPALKTFLMRKSWGITGVAAATLLQEGDETALEIVRNLLEDSDPNIRLQACLVLAMFGKESSVVRELQGAYASAEHEKKLHILEALGRIGNEESYRRFTRAFSHSSGSCCCRFDPKCQSMKEAKIKEAQGYLKEIGADGWLLYDFHRNNELAHLFLDIPKGQITSRRFFYWIPAVGAPVQIVHAIESHVLSGWPGIKKIFLSWQSLEEALRSTLKGVKKVAMEYSPKNENPYVSRVDGGTIGLISSMGIEVISSGGFLPHFTAVLSQKQADSHYRAAAALDRIVGDAWEWIGRHLKNGETLSEYDVQQKIWEDFQKAKLIADDLPIVAVNAHSADPHYEPKAKGSSPIVKGDFILIDLSAKESQEGAIFGDITRVGVAAERPTSAQVEIFEIVRNAQRAAAELVKTRFAKKAKIEGWEVDDAARKIIQKAGFGEFFIHRTGHSIEVSLHGSGAHMDNLEMHDTRGILPGTCFSIEPGIYLPGQFGVRLEYDIYVHPDGIVEITGGEQDEIVCLL
ncbi:MAG: M24 family metallopeptidase [Chlamydiota bacterium]